jgi:hypothetical protein
MPSGSSRNSGNARLAIPSAGRKAATSAALWAVLIGRQGPTRAGVSISAPAGRGRACRGRRRIRHDQMRRAGGELVDLRTGQERVDLQGAALTDEDHVALGVPSRRPRTAPASRCRQVPGPGKRSDRASGSAIVPSDGPRGSEWSGAGTLAVLGNRQMAAVGPRAHIEFWCAPRQSG